MADVVTRLTERDDVRRLRELAEELTAGRRLVLACQVAFDMDCKQLPGSPCVLIRLDTSVESAVPTRQINLPTALTAGSIAKLVQILPSA